MTQISTELSEDEYKELDKLVKYGVFNDEKDAVNFSVKLLIKQEKIKNEDLIKGIAAVNGFLMDNLGDLPFATHPLSIYHNNKKVYKFPIKTRLGWDKNILLGFVCVDSETFEIVPEISDSPEKLNKICEQIEKEVESSLS